MIRIALTKGRLEKKTTALLESLGYDCAALHDKGRRLILPVGDDIEVVLAKAPDVITYVDSGVCDLGVVGRDTLLEMGGSFYEVADLRFGACRFALAAPSGVDFFEGYRTKCVATKYPAVAEAYFRRRGVDVRIIKIEGSVELAPLLGLADGIVDIVETGATLRENGLGVIEYAEDISARLIVNVASLKMNKPGLSTVIDAVQKAVAEKEETK